MQAVGLYYTKPRRPAAKIEASDRLRRHITSAVCRPSMGRGNTEWGNAKNSGGAQVINAECCELLSTVSYAATVVSGIPPIHLLTEEHADIYGGVVRKEARSQLLAKWQREWEDAEKGRLMCKLI